LKKLIKQKMEGPIQKKTKISIFLLLLDTGGVFFIFGRKKNRERVKNKKIKEI